MKFIEKKIKKILSYSVYRRTFYAYSVSFFVLVVLILASVFTITLSDIKSQSTQSSQQLLTQLVNSAETVKSSVENIASIVAGDANTMHFAKNKKDNKLEDYYLYKRLSETKTAYNYVEDISVINLNNGNCVSITANNKEKEVQDFVNTALANQRLIVSRTVFYFQRKVNVVTFLKVFPYDNAMIVIDVNSEWLQFDLVNNPDVNRKAYIIDAMGNPVTSNTRTTLGEGDTAYYLYNIVKDVKENEYVYSDSESGKMLFFEKSEKMAWWFVDIQDFSFFYASFQKMAFLFLGIALFFILLCVAISVIFNRKIHEPLIQLVNRCRVTLGFGGLYPQDELKYIDMAVARVEHERYKNETYIKSLFLRNTILGEELPFSISSETINSLIMEYDYPYHAVILFKIQNIDEIPEGKIRNEFKIFRYTVCNLSEEIFSGIFTCKSFDIGEDSVGLLLMLNEEKISDEYVICFKRLKEFVEKEIGITVSGSLGTIVGNLNHVNKSYQKAKQYLDMSHLTNREDIIDSNSAANVGYQEKNRRLIAEIIEYTKLNFANPDLSLKSISQNFGLSTAYLGKIFKIVEGDAYSVYLTNYRLKQSKTALIGTSKTVSEIALEIGFTNPTYYATVFKNAYGMTPSAFRGKLGK